MRAAGNMVRYLASPRSRFPVGAVLACSVVLAYFVIRTFLDRLPTQYRVDFGAAQWIQSPAASPVGYFRKTMYISGPLDQAWIAIAATDSYEVMVNDTFVAKRPLPYGSQPPLFGARTSGLHDLKALLRPGKNVIAVIVDRNSFPGAAQLRARGAYQVAGSPPREFLSDSGWKVSNTPDGVVGSYLWTASQLDDTLWTDAREGSSGERISTVQPLPFDPALVQREPRANWIAPRQPRARQASFLYDLKPGLQHGQTWLQIAATGAYDVLINGRLAISQPVDPQLLSQSLSSLQAGSQTIGNAVLAQELGSMAANAEIGPNPPEMGPTSAMPDLLSVVPHSSTPVEPVVVPSVFGSPPAPAIMPLAPPVDPGSEPQLTALTPRMPRVTAHAEGPGSLSAFHGPLDLTFTMLPAGIPAPAQRSIVALGVTGGVPVLLGYDISYWLGAGNNSIVIRVSPQFGTVGLLAQISSALANGSVSRVGTGANWRAIGCVEGERAPAPQSALIMGSYGSPPWGRLPQAAVTGAAYAPAEDFSRIVLWIAVILCSAASLLFLWLAASWCAALITGRPLEELLTADAVGHVLMLATLLLLWLLSYDIRFTSDWCFEPWCIGLALAVGVLSKVALFLPGTARPPRLAQRFVPLWTRPQVRWLALIAIVVGGFIVRAAGLTAISLDHDEISLVNYASGILSRGYPFLQQGSYLRHLTTYELVCYSLAASQLLFGTSELSIRLPALFFGTLSIGLIGWTGYRMFSWRVGLLSAFVYAFFPTAIFWSRNAFYLTQDQFFALLTVALFYAAIRGSSLNHRYLTLAAAAFVATYFSWEGSGFLLPAFVIALFAVRRTEYDWICDPHLWRCALVIGAIVIVQLAYRQLTLPPEYLRIGVDLDDVSAPGLVYLDPTRYNPLYYINFFLLQENSWLITALALGGLVFGGQDKATVYLGALLLTLLGCYTELLPHYALRYSFNLVPLMILLAAAAFVRLWDRLCAMGPLPGALAPAVIARATTCLLLAIVILSANFYVLEPYRFSSSPLKMGARLGVYHIDYRGTARFLGEHVGPSDLVIATLPHVFDFYPGVRPAYALSTMISQKVTYDGGLAPPRFIDKFGGYPVIRGLEDLEDLRSRYPRIWIVQAPTDDPLHPALSSYLGLYARIAFQTYNAKVIVIEGPQRPLRVRLPSGTG
jgi:Dolichyl-phosphate-mannose-protein mannosyltransferase